MNRTELHAKIKSICHDMAYKQGYINSIDVLKSLGYLSIDKINDWRNGRIPYLEKVCTVNLGTLSFINKTIRQISIELKLKQSLTDYRKYGKGVKTKLVFSKTADENIEKAYSTHYIDAVRINELKQKQTIEKKAIAETEL